MSFFKDIIIFAISKISFDYIFKCYLFTIIYGIRISFKKFLHLFMIFLSNLFYFIILLIRNIIYNNSFNIYNKT